MEKGRDWTRDPGSAVSHAFVVRHDYATIILVIKGLQGDHSLESLCCAIEQDTLSAAN